MQRLALSAYQSLTLETTDLGEQFTESGDAPRTMVGVLTTAMDEPFVNRSVKVLLTEEDQTKIILAFQANLAGVDF